MSSGTSTFTVNGEQMNSTVSEVLSIIRSVCPPPPPSVDDLDRPLVEYGIDSLDMSGILLAVEERYAVRISDDDMAGLNTVNSIAAFVDRHRT